VDRARRREWDRRSGQDRRQERERAGDAERRQGQDRSRGQDQPLLDRVQDEAKIGQLENRWRALEQQHPRWSHAFERHVDITEPQLARRAAAGELPNGEVQDPPRDATKWRSADAMVVAADGLAHSDEYQRKRTLAEANGEDRFEVTQPLSKVLGPGWRADVYGRSAASSGAQASQWSNDSFAVGRWRRQSDGRWHPITCYPQPGD
jgi:hypothetical protein